MVFVLAGRQMTISSPLASWRGAGRTVTTDAFFLDLQKAYDTVWRDGLLYVLWQKGIRGML
jgi:hypothetical protein